ncbi:MAG: thioredoxin [Chitinophagales bacterium]|nr:thioredoxin [Chitinophagales bacterium]
MATELNTQNFKATALADNTVALVDFWAEWCGPCKMIGPVIEELATEYEGKAVIGKLNVDENRDIAAEYGIMSIPTLLFFKNGEIVEKHVGLASKADLKRKLDAVIG